MPSILEKCLRPNVQKLVAYQSARGTAKAADDILLLDAAENPYCPFDGDAEWSAFQTLNRYPEPQPSGVVGKLATLYHTKPENLLLTRGSEEGIRLLLQAFCVPAKDSILICPPTFAMYPIEAAIHDVALVRVPRLGDDFGHLDKEGMMAAVNGATESHVKIVFICNPGNPASTLIPFAEIEGIIRALQDDCMVVIDEAYIDFADEDSFVSLMDTYPNLIILRTLSKGYGLAGLRLGAIVASAECIGYLKRLTAAYPVPRATQILAEEALSLTRQEKMKIAQDRIKSERDRMISLLRTLPSVKVVFDSQANFLCVVVSDAQKCVEHFAKNGITIRNRSANIPNALNIAIGLPEQNDKVLEAFQSFL